MTTTTISNPKNERAYALESVPEAGDEESRYLLGQTSSGWNVSRRIDSVASAYLQLASRLREKTADLSPAFVEVDLHYVGRRADGSYVLVKRGTVRAIPKKAKTKSGRFSRPSATGGALLDRIFLGEEDARDELIWAALLALCSAEAPTGRVLRDLNDATAELMCLRAGLVVDRRSLPQDHLR